MSDWPLLAFDVAAITVLGFGIYFPRYRRQDLLLSYVVLNLGVLTVMVALSDTEVGLGVGFGLFGILSIIRLRSAELEQQEIAYYFAALVLGLVNGVGLDPAWLAPALPSPWPPKRSSCTARKSRMWTPRSSNTSIWSASPILPPACTTTPINSAVACSNA